jgi:pyridoxine/pyridoxamine 5'-phosphate oxidase
MIMFTPAQKEQLLGIFSQHPTAVIATADAQATPGAAVVLTAVTKDMQIIFGTHPTRKYSNLKENPKAAFAFTKDWMSIQMHGVTEELSGEKLDSMKAFFVERHPEMDQHMFQGSAFFCFTPSWVRFMDTGAKPSIMWEATLTE